MSGTVSPTNGSKPVANGAPAEPATKIANATHFNISSLQSVQPPKGLFVTLWSGVKSVANFFHWMATKFVDLLCLRFLYRSDAPFEIKEFEEKVDRIRDWSISSEKKEKLFNELPHEFKTKVFEFINKISDKKILTVKELLAHPKYSQALDCLRFQFEYVIMLDLMKKTLSKIGTPKQNLALFLDLFTKSNEFRQFYQLQGLDSSLRDVGDKLKEKDSFNKITTNYESFLTKEKFESMITKEIEAVRLTFENISGNLERLSK